MPCSVKDLMKTKVTILARWLFLLSAIAPLSISAAPAEDSARYSGNHWNFLDAKTAIEAAGQITLAKYPDCDEATVDKKMVRVYRADGTGESQDETFVKVLTEKGKRNNRTLALSFMLPYFTVDVVKLEVIRPDGTIVPVDVAANSKEMIDDSQMSMNIYDPNSKILQVNIPQLEVGDVVHSIARATTQRSIIPGEFAEYNVFEGQGYIRHTTYEVHSPVDRPLQRVVVRDEIPGTIVHSTKTESGETGTLVHRWDVNNVPRMFEEPSMPAYENVLQRLLIGTTPNWQAVSKWYWELSKPHLEATTPGMKKTVEELTADSKTDMDKIKALFYHVSKKIRYMGLTPEKDRPGYEPHDVNLTFEKKYGVCRDKAALLVSLLRTAGLKAYPVLINVGSKKDPEVPEPFFNHAIVGVDLKDRDYILMDPTDENTRELLPASDRNQSYLVCRPEGENIQISPIDPPEKNMMWVKTAGVLNADGRLEAKSELAFDGVNDNSYREMFVRQKPDEIRRFFERNLKRSMPGARLTSVKLFPQDMLDITVPVRAELEFSADGLTATGSGKSVLSVPWIGKGLGLVNFILSGTGLEKRKYPLETFVACGLKEEVSLKLADGFTGIVSMPSCSPLQDESLGYAESFQFKDHTLSCSRELELKIVEFSPAQYLKLKRTLETLEYDARKTPVMALSAGSIAKAAPVAELGEDPPVDSNAKVLESRKELIVKDAHTSTYKVRYAKRILSYSGKIREAEVKIDFNPACQEAKLVGAVVTSKTGQRQEISKDEINIMDAGWNASAKRYTGGKILVANLPGVDIGSTIEVEYEITTRDKPFLSGFEAFQLQDELEQKSFKLTAPAGVKIQQIVSGPADIVKQEAKTENDQQLVTWRSQNVKAMPEESQLPPEWLFLPGVTYFAGDLNVYLGNLRDAMLQRSARRAKVEQLTRELTATTKTKLEAIKTIRDYVAKSIRTTGPSFAELPLTELSDADTTLTDGYGHMADHAILLHAMLAAAGFQPEFVLASGLPPISPITNLTCSCPMPQSFQVPLVRVKVEGEEYYLNDTDQYAQLGSTSFDGRLAITLANQSFEVVKAAKNCEDKHDTVYSLALSDTGKTQVRITRHYYGTEYNGKHRFFSELPPEERRRYFQEIVSGVAQGARPVGDLTTDFSAYPGIEQFTVEIDNYSVVDGKYLYFDLPFRPSLFAAGTDRRSLPLFISHASESTVRTEIEFPAKFRQRVIVPQNENLDGPDGGGKARITSTEADGKYVITHQFQTSPAIIAPKDYAALLHIESTLGRKSSRVFLLQED
jgi:transglutaminase-like putative cysteine protease